MITELLKSALAARENAHAPYSRYAVGACIRGENGGLFTGCNVENAAYPLGQCAEANAIAAMVLAGETRIREIVVVGPDDSLCTPCGGCRQRIAEFADANTPVHIGGDKGIRLATTLGELLPYAFDLTPVGPADS